MHNTHRFFLTERSLYLLMVNAREDERANRLNYWLNVISESAPQSPIIIVINKIDRNPAFSLDERTLQIEYPTIAGFAYTNCEEYCCKLNMNVQLTDSFEPLETLIADTIATKLPHINDVLPVSWFNLKRELEELKIHTIPFATYQSLCEKHGLQGEEIQRGYLRVLHELGTILNYPDDPRLANFGIMNRNWIVQGVYAIITSQLLANRRGKLHLRDLPLIYTFCETVSTSDYPANTHTLLISMMQKFELCYPFDMDGTLLVPDLLSKQAPDEIDINTWTADSLAFRYEYESLPSSILSRFIVRRHTNIVTLWRTGVVLQRDGLQALVRSNADGIPPTIAIDITGQGDRREFLAIIRDTFEQIHAPAMTVLEMVALPEHPDVAIPYVNLRRMIQRGIEQQYVPEIDDFIDPRVIMGVVERSASLQAMVPVRSEPQTTDTVVVSEKWSALRWIGQLTRKIGRSADTLQERLLGIIVVLGIVAIIVNNFVELPLLSTILNWLQEQWSNIF